jgi:hypothetical protein
VIFTSEQDALLLHALRGHPRALGESATRELFAHAERHGVLGVVLDAHRAAQLTLPAELDVSLAAREVARSLDHAAHLALLTRIDERFAEAGLAGVVLKGPLFAERFYASPSGRATTDLDLLVTPETLDAAAAVLVSLGYVAETGANEERFRHEHHHLHFSHPHALPLELHFHATSNFGRVLESGPLLGRRAPSPLGGTGALGVLEPADELVYLAAHAASHRFVRLGWLYDLRLLVEPMSEAQLGVAARRARELGFGRALAFTRSLLTELFDVPPSRLAPLGEAGFVRRAVARRTMGEPTRAVVRYATQLAYTAALADTTRAAVRHTLRSAAGHGRRLLGR